MSSYFQNPESLFDWDKANILHIARHDVIPEEVEQVLLGDTLDLDFDSELNDEPRYTYLGETSQGRILIVVITWRGEKMRVVTAYDAEKRDKLLYLETKAGWNDGSEGS